MEKNIVLVNDIKNGGYYIAGDAKHTPINEFIFYYGTKLSPYSECHAVATTTRIELSIDDPHYKALEIHLPFPAKKRNASAFPKLEKNECFYILRQNGKERGYALYIPIENIDHSYKENVVYYSKELEFNYCHMLLLNLEMKGVEIPVFGLTEEVLATATTSVQSLSVMFNINKERTEFGKMIDTMRKIYYKENNKDIDEETMVCISKTFNIKVDPIEEEEEEN